MPEGLVRDAILSSPAWPDMAAKMALLDQRGVDVAGFLSAAHGQGIGVDRAVAALLAQQGATAPAAGPAAGVPAARPAPAPDPDPYAAAAAPAAAPAPGAADPAREPVVVSADARAMWGPLTEGLKVPNDLDLSDRAAVLEQLDVTVAANSRLVGIVKDYVGSEGETALLVATRAWGRGSPPRARGPRRPRRPHRAGGASPGPRDGPPRPPQ
ncbi:hypothetical protein ACFQ7H_31870, partial [Streptomyces sp. NPDC056492]